MSFHTTPLPNRFALGAQGGPMFSTEVVDTTGGQQYINGNWLMPLHVFDVSELAKGPEEFAELKAYFMVVGGRRDGFPFKDWSDFQANRDPLALVSGSVYQLLRRYVSGSRTFDRPIYKPYVALVFRTRSGSTSAISPSIDLTTGLVTVSGHVSGDTYSWSGEFYVPVRFTNDQLQAVIKNRSGGGFVFDWPSVGVKEYRLNL